MGEENTPEDMLLRVMLVAELLLGEKRAPQLKPEYSTDDLLSSPSLPNNVQLARNGASKTKKRKSGVQCS